MGKKKRRKPITKLKRKRAIFNRVKNPKYWKRPTKTVYVKKLKDAERIRRAITHYAGGCEYRKVKGRFAIHSKGYYHYIGA